MTTTSRTNNRLRAIRGTATAAAITALLLTTAAAPSHAATGHTVTVNFGSGMCPAGGSVKAVQFGSADALTSVPKKTGNSASIKIKTGTRHITFTGVAWCKTTWWKPITPAYFSKRVYVKATQNTINL
jgi:hypothetical protein